MKIILKEIVIGLLAILSLSCTTLGLFAFYSSSLWASISPALKYGIEEYAYWEHGIFMYTATLLSSTLLYLFNRFFTNRARGVKMAIIVGASNVIGNITVMAFLFNPYIICIVAVFSVYSIMYIVSRQTFMHSEYNVA